MVKLEKFPKRFGFDNGYEIKLIQIYGRIEFLEDILTDNNFKTIRKDANYKGLKKDLIEEKIRNEIILLDNLRNLSYNIYGTHYDWRDVLKNQPYYDNADNFIDFILTKYNPDEKSKRTRIIPEPTIKYYPENIGLTYCAHSDEPIYVYRDGEHISLRIQELYDKDRNIHKDKYSCDWRKSELYKRLNYAIGGSQINADIENINSKPSKISAKELQIRVQIIAKNEFHCFLPFREYLTTVPLKKLS